MQEGEVCKESEGKDWEKCFRHTNFILDDDPPTVDNSSNVNGSV